MFLLIWNITSNDWIIKSIDILIWKSILGHKDWYSSIHPHIIIGRTLVFETHLQPWKVINQLENLYRWPHFCTKPHKDTIKIFEGVLQMFGLQTMLLHLVSKRWKNKRARIELFVPVCPERFIFLSCDLWNSECCPRAHSPLKTYVTHVLCTTPLLFTPTYWKTTHQNRALCLSALILSYLISSSECIGCRWLQFKVSSTSIQTE